MANELFKSTDFKSNLKEYIDIDKMINSLYLSRLSKTILSIKKIKWKKK